MDKDNRLGLSIPQIEQDATQLLSSSYI